MIRHEVVKCRIIRVAESIRSEGVKDTDMGGKGTRKCESARECESESGF